MPSFFTPPYSDSVLAIMKLLKQAGIKESDLVERFVRASGPGGQKVNKTSSAVYIKHLPSGHEVKAQTHRSQSQNRMLARQLLAERLLSEKRALAQKLVDTKERARRSSRPPSKRAKLRNIEAKRSKSAKKQMRKLPSHHD